MFTPCDTPKKKIKTKEKKVQDNFVVKKRGNEENKNGVDKARSKQTRRRKPKH